MTKAVRLRHRRRLRRKEAEPALTTLRETFGMEKVPLDAPLEAAELEHMTLYILEDRVVAFDVEGQVAPSLRGLLLWPAAARWVTVDMGAVRFVTNGADVMSPGIRAADPSVRPGDAVWVRDETHGRPLAVGVALLAGPELVAATQGKGVANKHTVGDALWRHGDPE
jgi:PUA-domain protein